MPKIRGFVVAALLAVLPVGAATAHDAAKRTEAPPQSEYSKEKVRNLELKLATNKAFLNAASRIIAASGNQEAESYLKQAQSLSNEADAHFKSNEYSFALEDVAESTRMAVYAITFTKGSDASTRDTVIEQEMQLRSEHDHEKKEGMITKGTAEVETFIRTAERLLESNPGSPEAVEKLNDAKRLLAASREAVEQNKYDEALDDINSAYQLATHSVKDVKRSQNEVLTFPKPKVTDEKAMFEYELKKNDTYFFFAGQVVNGPDRDARKMYRTAQDARDEAMKSREKGETKKAIDRLRDSTNLLIKAIRGRTGAPN